MQDCASVAYAHAGIGVTRPVLRKKCKDSKEMTGVVGLKDRLHLGEVRASSWYSEGNREVDD